MKRNMLLAAFVAGLSLLAWQLLCGEGERLQADAENGPTAPVTAADALGRLLHGNARFVGGRTSAKDYSQERARLVSGQQPYAIVLTCSDSRVAPELVFDESLGKLFVVRDAGNVVDPVVLGSVEYAAEHLHARLFLVLGHDSCGAVAASLGTAPESPHLAALVQAIAPAAQEAKRQGLDAAHTLDAAVRANVLLQARRAVADSAVLKRLEGNKQLQVAAAVYHLRTGKVELLQSVK